MADAVRFTRRSWLESLFRQPTEPESHWELLTRLAAIAIACGFLFVVTGNFFKARNRGEFNSCSTALRTISGALDIYTAEHKGRLPSDLSRLQPEYLKSVGVCPRQPHPHYDYRVLHRDGKPAYVLSCPGGHRDSGWLFPSNYAFPGFPQFHSGTGIVDRPKVVESDG
jgi:hypothetical protein